MNRVSYVVFGAAFALLAGQSPHADERKFDSYTLNYNAFPSDFLSPQIARAYGIRRSKNRGVLNVSVSESQPGGLPKPVEAEINARAVNVYQQVKPLKLRKVIDGDAIYYIAEFPVANQEIINFEITVRRDGKEIGSAKLQKQFFTD